MRWSPVYAFLISTFCSLTIVPVEAQDAPVTRMPSFRNLIPGQLVTFPVIVTGFRNIGSVSLSCDFDNSSLNFVSAEINAVIINGGVTNVGDNDLGNGFHRLRFGWYGNVNSLPDSSWIVKYTFRYLSGNPSIKWFDNGPSCSFTDPAGTFLNDIPFVSYFHDGSICKDMPPPGLISGPTSVNEGSTNVIYSIVPLQNILSYSWSVPVGAHITTGFDSNSITVDYPAGAMSGNIAVKGIDACGSGPVSAIAVNLVNIPLGVDSKPDINRTSDTGTEFIIYPNPANEYFILRSTTPLSRSVVMRVVSPKGEVLKKNIIEARDIENEYMVNISGLSPGIYTILIENEPGLFFKKLIIK